MEWWNVEMIDDRQGITLSHVINDYDNKTLNKEIVMQLAQTFSLNKCAKKDGKKGWASAYEEVE